MSPIVQFHHVSKAYRLGLTRTSLPGLARQFAGRVLRGRATAAPRTLWALEDVSFDLHRGESLALIGPNGAGKSTILKLLSHITWPTRGDIHVDGRLCALLELGAGFHPDLTGRDNIFLNGTILGLSRAHVAQRFDEIVDFSGLEAFIDTPLKRYSSGMQVRLGFAVAACVEPDILLVDEVLAVGDASFRQRCLQRIAALRRQGTSVIFVSHNLYMVQAVCTRGIYLQAGRVRRAGGTAEAIGAYELDLHAERARRFDDGDEPSAAAAEAPPGLEEPAVDITQVTVHGPAGDEVLVSDQPARIRLHYTAYRDLDAINLAVFIRRDDGVACSMIRSKLDNFRVRLPRGQGRITLDLSPLQLVTGSYFAEVEVTDEADTMVIKQDKARSEWFLVRGRTRSYDPAFAAVFEPFARWSGPEPAGLEP
ncbi:MAG: ABC transporter ATP-binding protein [Vicinamibacterales bacterium]